MGIVVGILILSLLMFIHELGHYISGRLLGFKILEFSLFMGPVLLSKTSKKTNIKYSLKLLPIGASVRFLGEEGMGEAPSEDKGAFNNMPKWKRAVTIATGPIVNILAGVLALIILFTSIGFITTTVGNVGEKTQAASAGVEVSDKILKLNGSSILTSTDYAFEANFLPEGQKVNLTVLKNDGKTVKDYTLIPEKISTFVIGITRQSDDSAEGWVISSVDPKSNNGKPVIKAGDIVLSVGGVSTKDSQSAISQIAQSKGSPLAVVVKRDGKEIELITTPMISQYYNPIGIDFKSGSGFAASIGESFKFSVSILKVTFKGIAMMISGKIKAKDGLAGPVGIVMITGTIVDQKIPVKDIIYNLLSLFALISLSLGIFNLLPIPALDGSHLLLITIEAIRGKRLPAAVENKIIFAGFMFIIALAILGLVFDIMRLFKI